MVNLNMINKVKKYLDKNIGTLNLSRILILGGTGEIGSAIIEELIYLKANVIMVSRSSKKANELIQKIKKKYNYANIEVIIADLLNKNDVDELLKKIPKLNLTNVIINSAINTSDELASYIVNTYVPYMIINKAQNINVIVTSSISYKSKKKNDYYSIHKRNLMQLLYYLNKNNHNIVLAHPGIVYTRLFYERNKKYKFIFPLLRLFMPSVYKAGLNIIYALNKKLDRDKWIGPAGIFNSFGYPKISKLKKKIFLDLNLIEAVNQFNSFNNKY